KGRLEESQEDVEATRPEGGWCREDQGVDANKGGASVVAGSIADHQRLMRFHPERRKRGGEHPRVRFLEAMLERDDVGVELDAAGAEEGSKIHVEVAHQCGEAAARTDGLNDLRDIGEDGPR